MAARLSCGERPRPFVSGRIIDLSEHARDLLGFRQTDGPVRVTFLGGRPLRTRLAPPSQETPPEIAHGGPAAPGHQV
jgi:rare lipoprotein A (peptidoglycan hydrolase)